MKRFIKPAFSIMDSLSYRSKFMLMASFFIIPLVLLSARLALTFHEEADQAERARNGLSHLEAASDLIRNLETLRDTSVISFVHSNTLFEVMNNQAKNAVLDRIDKLSSETELGRHRLFLTKLKLEVREDRISPGSEAARIQAVFENANTMVEQTYLWRLKLAYEFMSKSNTSSDALTVLDLLNTNSNYFLTLGETRALGSFYLHQQYIDSHGITLLDDNYVAYSKLLDSLDIKTKEYEKVFKQDTSNVITQLKSSLTIAQSLLDEQLLQVMTPDSDPSVFYQSMSTVIDTFYEHNNTLIDKADELLGEQHAIAQTRLTVFYSIAILTALLSGYLYIGFFANIKITIRSLVQSAKRVANGEYESSIQITAKDELKELAIAMDEMRQKLKARENELTLMGQTDGLSTLKNRKYFDEALPMIIANCERNQTPVSLVLLDIDHFKSVNDQHGHQQGDECIKQVASLMKEEFKRKIDVVARYGGEEFVAIVSGMTLDQTIAQAERLRKRIASHTIDCGSARLSITSSFGVASVAPGDHIIPSDLIELADHMLYKAKQSGRNRVVGSLYKSKVTTLNPNRAG